MTDQTTRRTLLRSIGAAGLAVGLAGCSGNGDGNGDDDGDGTATETGTDDGDAAEAVATASFSASLSDDGSIPGHESANSEGTGQATFEGTDDGTLSFEVTWEDLEGKVNGIHIHGEGSASGGYLVRLFEPEDSEHADGAIVTDSRLSADSGSISDAIADEHVNPSGDYDGEIETTAELVAELETADLGESGGVVNIHTEHAPDSELAGQVQVE